MVYSHNGILHSNENYWTIASCNNMDESHKHNADWKKLDPRVHAILAPSIYGSKIGESNRVFDVKTVTNQDSN